MTRLDQLSRAAMKLSDEELIDRVRDGEMTALALALAKHELFMRGIDVETALAHSYPEARVRHTASEDGSPGPIS
jgi:hypothetical protein